MMEAIDGCVYEPRRRPIAIALYAASDGWKPSHEAYFSGLLHTVYSPDPELVVGETP